MTQKMVLHNWIEATPPSSHRDSWDQGITWTGIQRLAAIRVESACLIMTPSSSTANTGKSSENELLRRHSMLFRLTYVSSNNVPPRVNKSCRLQNCQRGRIVSSGEMAAKHDRVDESLLPIHVIQPVDIYRPTLPGIVADKGHYAAVDGETRV